MRQFLDILTMVVLGTSTASTADGDAKYIEILDDYPHITQEDIYACLLFAQQAIDSSPFASVTVGNRI